MTKKSKIVLFVGGTAAVIALLAFLLRDSNIAVLNPKGAVAAEQRDLMIITVLLMLIPVVPVFILLAFICIRFREGNTKAKYRPEWDGSKILETIWWGVPLAVIVVLGGIIWKSSHQLDPYKELQAEATPVKVQVVALEWKWLFIYPEYGIASVNHLQIPEDTPINFELTSDAPMNSFWVPQLGGQVYAMAGMKTKLHLIADEPGEYEGYSANLSGEGYAGMRFKTKAVSDQEFVAWTQSARQSPDTLDYNRYTELVKPSKDNPLTTFATVENGLFDIVISKYMPHETTENGGAH